MGTQFQKAFTINAYKEYAVPSFLFTSSNGLTQTAFSSLDALSGVCEEIFDITLSNQEELESLLGLLGIFGFEETVIRDSAAFSIFIDLSMFRFPVFDGAGFDHFYELWLKKTGRESSMDEYGQLLFLQTYAEKWNENESRVVIFEKP